MKKILGVLILSLLLSENAYASCSDYLSFTWTKDYPKAKFEFKSTSDKKIYITDLYIYKDSKIEVKRRTSDRYIASMIPYGKTTATINIGNLNQDLIKQASYSCSYKPKELTAERKKILKKRNEMFNKKESWFKWWYLIFALPILGLIIQANEDKDKKKIDKTSSATPSKASSTKSSTNLADSGNLIEDVWEGRKPLGESFWLYYFILNGIISFGAGFLAEMNDNNIFLIAALISNIWAGVGTWNSSTNYQVQKIKTKQPYGWAYGAKILIVLNFLTIGGQAILLFNL